LYKYETWYLIQSEEHRLRVFWNWVLTSSGPKGEGITGHEEICIMRSFIRVIGVDSRILLKLILKEQGVRA
jgi:hypothetical protein